MKSNKVFWAHSSAVSALFFLGNAIIKAPTNQADEFTFLAYLITCGIGFLLYFPISFLSMKIYCESLFGAKVFRKIFISIILLAVSIVSCFTIAETFMDYVNFIKEEILVGAHLFSIVLIFGLVCLFFALKRQEDFLKFGLLCFWFVFALILFFFFAALPNYSLRNIFIFRLPDIKTLFKQSLPYFKNPVLPSLLLPVYNALVFKSAKKSSLFSGYLLGAILLGLGILSPVLLFGTSFAGNLDFPFFSAVSTVSIGRLFTRLDGFSYFIYFSAAIMRINVCVFIIYSSLKKISEFLRNN